MNVKENISNFIDDTKERVGDAVDNAREWFDVFDPDKGPCVANIPVIGKCFEEKCAEKEECTNVNKINDNKMLIGGMGMVGCGLLGYSIGDNFGTFGRLAGCAIGAWVGCKFSKEFATDIAAASDYVNNNSKDGMKSKKNLLEASIANIGNFGGQSYTGKTIDITD